MSEARLSVVVVTYHDAAPLRAALPALLPQLGPDDELLIVDNASTDGTLAAARELAPDALLFENGENLGFAAAANQGAARASGDLLLFLNPDSVPAAGFAEAIRAPLRERRGWSAWMGLVTLDGGSTVNTSGGVVHFTGIAWAGQAGEPVERAPREPREVAFASGACLAVPREVWRRLDGFPEHYFMYCEDVDLSLRLWLAGERVGIEPTARVDHAYEFEKGPLKWRLLERNRWATLIRTYPSQLLAVLAPALIATELVLAVVAVAGGWGAQKARATTDVLQALPRLLAERRAVQARGTVSAREFACRLTTNLSSPYVGRLGRSRLMRVLLRAYWRAVLTLLPS